MGYAAGRWRLPTYSEVEFVMKLSADSKIPRLFGDVDDVWYYWSAQGLAKVDKLGGDIYPSLVGGDTPQRARFVYDEWYWGSKTLKKNGNSLPASRWDFTWGDEPRN